MSRDAAGPTTDQFVDRFGLTPLEVRSPSSTRRRRLVRIGVGVGVVAAAGVLAVIGNRALVVHHRHVVASEERAVEATYGTYDDRLVRSAAPAATQRVTRLDRCDGSRGHVGYTVTYLVPSSSVLSAEEVRSGLETALESDSWTAVQDTLLLDPARPNAVSRTTSGTDFRRDRDQTYLNVQTREEGGLIVELWTTRPC